MIERGNEPDKVDLFIKRHRVVGAGPPSEGQFHAMQIQLEHEDMDDDEVTGSRRTGFTEAADSSVEARLNRLQKNIADATENVERVITRAEETRNQRQLAMSSLLDAIIRAQGSTDKEKSKQMERMIREELQNMKM